MIDLPKILKIKESEALLKNWLTSHRDLRNQSH